MPNIIGHCTRAGEYHGQQSRVDNPEVVWFPEASAVCPRPTLVQEARTTHDFLPRVTALSCVCVLSVLNSSQGKCLYYREWNRPQNTLEHAADDGEEQRLMFGMLYSLKASGGEWPPIHAVGRIYKTVLHRTKGNGATPLCCAT